MSKTFKCVFDQKQKKCVSQRNVLLVFALYKTLLIKLNIKETDTDSSVQTFLCNIQPTRVTTRSAQTTVRISYQEMTFDDPEDVTSLMT